MKVGAVAVPVIVVALIFALVWGVSMATMQAGARAVEGGLEMVRLQLRVARMQEEVLRLSRQSLELQLAELDALKAGAASRSPETVDHDDPGAGTVELDGNRETGSQSEWPRVEPRSGSTTTADK
jgi:hypothetical protein